ncbi:MULTISPECIES: alpha/beta hydrolase fold domain-containing protein [unclassified Pseudonocardia]|uniref:alpha/beta hydrolase fold domain-containing protein n=1 Tax=unclassified Pseudonocardia TaxID=2619320 RepID=UPI0001FFEF32|nr:alpha/beta hydrolase fold domain-containing protein [Pseudonocardia sp. Ae707_Ps1]OLM17350.1 putative esterase [Pseudonocardia sp. Ae707_Ps1]
MATSAPSTPAVAELWPGGELPPSLREPAPGARVVLYLHGGAFLFDEEPDLYADRVAAALDRPVLMLHYRVGAENPFPAASDDVIAAYALLLDAGWAPGDILVLGHSAGGTLGLTLLTRSSEHGLPTPAGVVSLSAFLDFTLTQQSLADNDGLDQITPAQAHRVGPMYTGSSDPGHPAVSPAVASPEVWRGAPPLFLLCGADELLRDDTLAVARSAARAGCEVELRVVAGGQHGSAQRAHPMSDRLLVELAAFAERCDDPMPAEQTWIGPSLEDMEL